MTFTLLLIGALGKSWRINKRTGRFGNQRKSRDYLNYYLIGIAQNTEKSPGDLRRRAVTQTPGKVLELTLMWKTPKEQPIIIIIIIGGLITAIGNNTDNTMDNRMTITRKQKWEEKQLYGHFKGLINTVTHQKTWTQLRKGNLREKQNLSE